MEEHFLNVVTRIHKSLAGYILNVKDHRCSFQHGTKKKKVAVLFFSLQYYKGCSSQNTRKEQVTDIYIKKEGINSLYSQMTCSFMHKI